VANAFIGMVSARAYRPGIGMQEAVVKLYEEADKIYDRRVVVALMNYLENKNGIEQWNHFYDIPNQVDGNI
jgi:HD-GYP domain-containing protein (c-di-GMP phosphodiesterase class II)